jgi:hypothetical protein
LLLLELSRREKLLFRGANYFSCRENDRIHRALEKIRYAPNQFIAVFGEIMVKKITAIRRYRPEIKRERTLQTRHLVHDIARSSSLNEGSIRFVVYELRDAILRAHRIGQAVKIEGLGTFTPTIHLDGSLDILFRPDPDMLRQLNDRTKFYAKILNKANIGKSAEELVEQWNQKHPDDPVEG